MRRHTIGFPSRHALGNGGQQACGYAQLHNITQRKVQLREPLALWTARRLRRR